MALQYITSEEDIWYSYLNDFITHKLRLVDLNIHVSSKNIVRQWILQTEYLQHHLLESLVKLHCYISFDLVQMATILRPLSRLELVSTNNSNYLFVGMLYIVYNIYCAMGAL